MRRIPFALTAFRLLLGPLALFCALRGAPRIVYLPILVSATLSDILDGVLARALGVATPFLRRFDSITDLIFYLFVLVVVWMECEPVVRATWWAILVILLAELATIAVCAARFRRYPATHTYLAKSFGLFLLAGLTALLVFGAGGWVIEALMIVALLTNAEIVAIHFKTGVPPVDVRSIFALPEGRRN